MNFRFIAAAGMITTFLTTVALAIGGLIVISYYPDSALTSYLILAAACLLGLIVLSIFMKRWQDDPLSLFDAIFATALGIPLLVAGSFFFLTSFGEGLVYVVPMILGLCLVAVASEAFLNRGQS